MNTTIKDESLPPWEGKDQLTEAKAAATLAGLNNPNAASPAAARKVRESSGPAWIDWDAPVNPEPPVPLIDFAKTLNGINAIAVSRDLHDLGYLIRRQGKYVPRKARAGDRRWFESRDVNGRAVVFVTAVGRELMRELAKDKKLTSLKGPRHAQ
ncbi:hypothetical protein [Cupriavidus sp. D39]|uniref:hypothetical protein n=1 Tax=Cupriavidus sp. D39 TaxID=2997877 RepID=UPI002272295B|nr:hypothetical protein [Cupriavidus sp. D39]MCY0856439.1 hypothetical protein [Cupriavidus sp. D39]